MMRRHRKVLICVTVLAPLAVSASLYAQYRQNTKAQREYQRLARMLDTCETVSRETTNDATCSTLRLKLRKAKARLDHTPERG